MKFDEQARTQPRVLVNDHAAVERQKQLTEGGGVGAQEDIDFVHLCVVLVGFEKVPETARVRETKQVKQGSETRHPRCVARESTSIAGRTRNNTDRDGVFLPSHLIRARVEAVSVPAFWQHLEVTSAPQEQ